MSSLHVLAIDLGSTGAKVALVRDDGHLVARAIHPVETTLIGDIGGEQDPVEIWAAVVGAVKEVVATAGVAPELIRGIVCDSHYFSLIGIDAEGTPTTKCIMWMDQRGAPYSMQIYEREPDSLGRWLDVHGLPAIPNGTDSLAHLLYLREEQPQAYERTHAFVEPMDYLNCKLTGNISANACTIYPLLLTDNRDLANLHYDDKLLEMTGVDRDKLPALLPVDEIVGTLRSDVAKELGLLPSTEVFGAMNDTQAVTVGAGAFLPGRGGVNIGTTTQVLAHVDSMACDLERSIVSMPSPLTGRYMACGENGLGGKLLEHFVLNVVYPKDAFADHTTEDVYAALESVIAAEPVGSGGLLFLPWYTGTQAPVLDPNARGAFLNMSLTTTRARMMRAVVEGISLNMRWTLPAIETLNGGDFDEVVFSGGGAISDVWSQLLADVLERPVLQVSDARFLNARGAAFVAMLRVGITDLDQIDAFSPIKQRYEPRPVHQKTYSHLFEQFVRAYEQNKPIFDELNADPAALDRADLQAQAVAHASEQTEGD
jgi:xylulokinase